MTFTKEYQREAEWSNLSHGVYANFLTRSEESSPNPLAHPGE